MGSPSFYAGIGSRKTPEPVIQYMRRVSQRLAANGYVLRSGAADGADAAFEQGCTEVGGACEIWLPWPGFNGHADTGLLPTPEHFAKASTVHPAWDRLTRGPRALHARNVGQVLGGDLIVPVDFVVAWTHDGCESESERTTKTGGTGTAIVLASRQGIPVFNLANSNAKERLAQFMAGRNSATSPSSVPRSNHLPQAICNSAVTHSARIESTLFPVQQVF